MVGTACAEAALAREKSNIRNRIIPNSHSLEGAAILAPDSLCENAAALAAPARSSVLSEEAGWRILPGSYCISESLANHLLFGKEALRGISDNTGLLDLRQEDLYIDNGIPSEYIPVLIRP
jgi:hypothetical protein